MNKLHIIVLYKNKEYKVIKYKHLYRELQNTSNIKYILFPSLTSDLIYYPIIPNKCLLSTKFTIDINFNIGDFDFDEDTFAFIDEFSSHYETTSVFQFIEYLSIFYKLSGSAEITESLFLSESSNLCAIYPVNYKITFDKMYSKYNIDSGDLKRVLHDCYLPDTAFNWITEGRMDPLSDLLYIIDSSKNSATNLPLFIGLYEKNWIKAKYTNNLSQLNLPLNTLSLIKLEGYNSYYLTTYELFIKMMHIETLSINVLISTIDSIRDSIYVNYALNYETSSQDTRDELCKYIKDEFAYYFDYTFSIGDVYSFLIWISFNQDIISYLCALFKSYPSDKLLIVRCIEKGFTASFSYDDIVSGKLIKYIYSYITRRIQ